MSANNVIDIHPWQRVLISRTSAPPIRNGKASASDTLKSSVSWRVIKMSSAKVYRLFSTRSTSKLTEWIIAENMRRMFYKWLTAARTARHRRVVLQEKEQEMKRYMLASAWDRWRGAYKTEKLRPVVCLMSNFHTPRPQANSGCLGTHVHASERERSHV